MPSDLSLCAMAMLAVIVDRKEVSTADLREAVRVHANLAQWIGHPWPAEESDWIDELQTLLDREFVVRVAAEKEYRYRPTTRAFVIVRANLHPRSIDMRSAS